MLLARVAKQGQREVTCDRGTRRSTWEASKAECVWVKQEQVQKSPIGMTRNCPRMAGHCAGRRAGSSAGEASVHVPPRRPSAWAREEVGLSEEQPKAVAGFTLEWRDPDFKELCHGA